MNPNELNRIIVKVMFMVIAIKFRIWTNQTAISDQQNGDETKPWIEAWGNQHVDSANIRIKISPTKMEILETKTCMFVFTNKMELQLSIS